MNHPPQRVTNRLPGSEDIARTWLMKSYFGLFWLRALDFFD
jgi:hypothetical protein